MKTEDPLLVHMSIMSQNKNIVIDDYISYFIMITMTLCNNNFEINYIHGIIESCLNILRIIPCFLSSEHTSEANIQSWLGC